MRSPFPSPGRNTLLENIWQRIFNFSRASTYGVQRGLSRQLFFFAGDETLSSRNYDLELIEPIVRGGDKSYQLVEMLENCPEIATGLTIRQRAFWGNVTGDDMGFSLSPETTERTPIDRDVKDILQRLIDEVIGGLALQPSTEILEAYGDAFVSIGIDFRLRQIKKIQILPTFEMFRIEDKYGQLLGFQQRASLSNDEQAISYHPIAVAHCRYRHLAPRLYGRALTKECWHDYVALTSELQDLQRMVRATGTNPNIHILPDCIGDDYFEAYKTAHSEKMKSQNITDYYFKQGGDIKKLMSFNPDFKGVMESINLHRCRIAMKLELPFWLLGLSWPGAQDIAQQPSLAFVRSINGFRSRFVAEVLRHLCNLELALNDIPRERWNYRMVFPKIYVNPYEQQADPLNSDETDLKGVEDIDAIRTGVKDYLSLASDAEIRKQLDLLKEAG